MRHGLTVSQGTSGQTAWELATRPPPSELRGLVQAYCGFAEAGPDIVRRFEAPAPAVVVILGLGEATHAWRGGHRVGSSFVAGPGTIGTTTEHAGAQRGIEVRLSPPGAYRILGQPLGELTDRVVDLVDVWGQPGARLSERIQAADSWLRRLDLLDEFLLTRAGAGPGPDSAVTEAWTWLQRERGAVAVNDLAEQTGWSRRRLAERFRAQVGLTPKRAARLLRFAHAVQLLTGHGRRSLVCIAVTCGYYDQAHLNRDFHEFVGMTPVQYLAQSAGDRAAAGLTLHDAPPAVPRASGGDANVQDAPTDASYGRSIRHAPKGPTRG